MDLLYRAYSSPMDLMNRYINQGRFGTFVQGFLEAEFERKKEKAEQENDWKLWTAYIHSYSEESFTDWKKRVTGTASTDSLQSANSDADLTDDGIQSIFNKLFPS